MYAVLNHFTLKKPVDQALIDMLEQDFILQAKAYPGVIAFHFIRVADDHAMVAALFETREALDRSHEALALPWFAQHVGPYLARPPERRVGQVVASTAFE